jgi:hypothetical protein
MQRRQFITPVGTGPLTARAQQPGDRVRRIGVLMAHPEGDPEFQAYVAAFRENLPDLAALVEPTRRSGTPPQLGTDGGQIRFVQYADIGASTQHQTSAHLIVADDDQQATVQDSDLLAQHPPNHE